MSTFLKIAALAFTLALLIAGAFGPAAAAAQGGSETVTAQVTLTMPTGEQVSGTMVTHRALGATIQSTWTFSGMLNGQLARAAGTATERWLGEGRLEVAMTAITEFTVGGEPIARNPDGTPYIPQSLLQTVVIEDTGNGVVNVRGVPLAIGGPLLPPGSGDVSYVITNAGAGTRSITTLPNTADQAPQAAGMLAPILAGAALSILGLATLRRALAR